MIEAEVNADVAVGTLTVDSVHMGDRIKCGFDFLIVGKDTSSLTTANREAQATYEDAIGKYADAESPTQ